MANPRLAQSKERVLSRCEHDSWSESRQQWENIPTRHKVRPRFSHVVASLETRRRQMVERLVERTLAGHAEEPADDRSD